MLFVLFVALVLVLLSGVGVDIGVVGVVGIVGVVGAVGVVGVVDMVV